MRPHARAVPLDVHQITMFVLLLSSCSSLDDFSDLSTASLAANDSGPSTALLFEQNALSQKSVRASWSIGDTPPKTRVAMWRLSGGKVSTDNVVAGADEGWIVSAGGDFNNDGHGDILWYNPTTQAVAFWILQNTSLNSFSAAQLDQATTSVMTGDFDGDGRSDVLAVDSSFSRPRIKVWFTNDDGTLRASAAGWVDAPASPVAIADFNKDGRSDLVFRFGTQTEIWTMSIDGTHQSFQPGAATLSWSLIGAGDFNKDGTADLLWRNVDTGQVGIWVMTGPGTIASTSAPWTVSSDWTPIFVADMNGDNIADIVWRHNTGLVSIWTMDSPTSVRSFGPGQPAGLDWKLKGTTKLKTLPPTPPSLPAFDGTSALTPLTKKILVVPCQFSDHGAVVDMDQISLFFDSKLRAYFRTLSYDSLNLDITIWPVIMTLGDYSAEHTNSVVTRNRALEVKHCVDKAGVNIEDSYDTAIGFWTYDGDFDVNGDGVFNGGDQYDTAGADGKYVALGQSAMQPGVAAQEIIHTFGIPEHAFSEQQLEYDDEFDVMSCRGCNKGIDLNAAIRKRLNLLPANRTITIPFSKGRTDLVTLAALDHLDAIGSLAANVTTKENGTDAQYFVELRGTSALNSGLDTETVLIHKYAQLKGFLMGKAPGKDPNWLVGEQFSNSTGSLKIDVQEISPVSGRATIKITQAP